jgi:hypothetical protein
VANGETHPAYCDVDGDARDELVIGFGAGGGGWLDVRDDVDAGYGRLTWLRLDFPEYNAIRGETWPACGDLDGDGRDEIVVGLGPRGGGWVKLFDDMAEGFRAMPQARYANGWLRTSWGAYDASNGTVHPAVGNLDGEPLWQDPEEEIVLGLGGGGEGWVQIIDDALKNFRVMPGTPSRSGWLQLGWPEYESANGETWPAVGDLDGDGHDELVLGLGTQGGGWLRIFRGAAAGFAPVSAASTASGWVPVPWPAYNASQGATYPAVVDLDLDNRAELVIGLGSYTTNGGWMHVRNSLADGLTHRAWVRVRPRTTARTARRGRRSP